MGRGRKIEGSVTEEVVRIYFEEGKRSPKLILDMMADDPAYRDRLPSDRAVSNIIKQIKENYTPEQQLLDRPWQLLFRCVVGWVLMSLPGSAPVFCGSGGPSRPDRAGLSKLNPGSRFNSLSNRVRAMRCSVQLINLPTLTISQHLCVGFSTRCYREDVKLVANPFQST